MSHPLTNELIEQNSPLHIKYLSEGERYFATEAARWGATWQLEQCVEELECLLSIFGATGVIREEAVPTIVELFKSNMRPQEDN